MQNEAVSIRIPPRLYEQVGGEQHENLVLQVFIADGQNSGEGPQKTRTGHIPHAGGD